MVSDRNIQGFESAPVQDSSVAHAATEAYKFSEVNFYNCVFTNKATPDCGKTDTQLNNELNNAAPIYGNKDTTSGAIKDLQKGIHVDGRTRHDLMNAIEDASFGNIDGAMKHLREASADLNNAGGKIDSGLSKLGDGGQSLGSQVIQRGMTNEADCSENIQKAEQLLRQGDTDGAIDAMLKGVKEVAHRQHQTRDGIASLQGDNSAIDWQNFGPEVPSNFPNPSQGGMPNPGDVSSNFPSPFRGGFPNPGDITSNFPNLSDITSNLPNPFQGGFPNPGDIASNLPNPFEGGLPNLSDLTSSIPTPFEGGLPNPAKGLDAIAKNPMKPIENLLTPPKDAKDLVHKVFDPIGLFG